MNPILVESTIKNIMNQQLNNCKNDKFIKNSNIMNIMLFCLIGGLISFILFIKYKGKQNITEQKIKDNKKKHYILSKIQTFQKLKAKEFTNIPM
jgi:hypothetical protein